MTIKTPEIPILREFRAIKRFFRALFHPRVVVKTDMLAIDRETGRVYCPGESVPGDRKALFAVKGYPIGTVVLHRQICLDTGNIWRTFSVVSCQYRLADWLFDEVEQPNATGDDSDEHWYIDLAWLHLQASLALSERISGESRYGGNYSCAPEQGSSALYALSDAIVSNERPGTIEDRYGREHYRNEETPVIKLIENTDGEPRSSDPRERLLRNIVKAHEAGINLPVACGQEAKDLAAYLDYSFCMVGERAYDVKVFFPYPGEGQPYYVLIPHFLRGSVHSLWNNDHLWDKMS